MTLDNLELLYKFTFSLNFVVLRIFGKQPQLNEWR